MLEKGDPKVGSTVSGASAVTLTFSGVIFPDKSLLGVTDPDGHVVSVGKPYGDKKTIAVKLKSPLAPGKYKVTWNVLCDCGSMNPGDYRFTVR